MTALQRLCTIIVPAILLAACDAPEQSAEPRAARSVPVIVEPLRIERERTRVEAVGTSRALQTVDVRAAASGEVVAVNFVAGQQVSKGDVLLELDSRDQKLAVELAEVRLRDAERLLERYQRSGNSGAVLPTDVDAARTAVKAARIELDRAKIALQDRKVVAQFAGYVDITEVEPGDRITTDTLITTLDNRDKLLISFQMPELVFGKLKLGNPVRATPWSGVGETLTGEVVDIASRIDPQSRTVNVRAAVPNLDDTLRPGMSFRVSLDIEGKAYPVVAETAVSWGADGAYLWIVKDGQAERVNLNIIQRQKGRILFDADIEEGELIVVEGTQRMRAGATVDFRNRDTANAGTRKTDGVTKAGAMP